MSELVEIQGIFAANDNEELMLWQCGGCDGIHFYIHPSGIMTCGNCGALARDKRWFNPYDLSENA